MNQSWIDKVQNKYITIPKSPINIISIFDELKYDRSDLDLVSPAMRHHILERLKKYGFKQTSGNIIEQTQLDVRCIIPKYHALGSSPFDITRYTPKRDHDYYILTPTQTACQFVNTLVFDEAVDAISLLISKQPINLFKLLDFLENNPSHQDFKMAINHLNDLQKTAVESEQLRTMRSLG